MVHYCYLSAHKDFPLKIKKKEPIFPYDPIECCQNALFVAAPLKIRKILTRTFLSFSSCRSLIRLVT